MNAIEAMIYCLQHFENEYYTANVYDCVGESHWFGFQKRFSCTNLQMCSENFTPFAKEYEPYSVTRPERSERC